MAEFGAEGLNKQGREAAGRPEPLDEIHAGIKSVSYAPNGRFIIALDNGQTWRQIDGDSTPFRRTGKTVVVSRGILGSYNLVIDGHAGLYKVRRVQ